MRLAFLVPAPDYPEAWDWAFDVEAEALSASAEWRSTPCPWTEAARPFGYDLVLPLVVWGYHLQYEQWLRFLDRIEASELPVVNPPRLLRWNSDKAYLKELGCRGIPTVETIEVESLDDADLAAAADAFGDRRAGGEAAGFRRRLRERTGSASATRFRPRSGASG